MTVLQTYLWRFSTLILRYHLVDSGAYEAIDLVNNATIASSLADVRIRSEPHLFPYKHLTFNFFSRSKHLRDCQPEAL